MKSSLPAIRKITEKKLTAIGYTPAYKDSEAFTKFVFEEEKVFAKIAKQAGIKVE